MHRCRSSFPWTVLPNENAGETDPAPLVTRDDVADDGVVNARRQVDPITAIGQWRCQSCSVGADVVALDVYTLWSLATSASACLAIRVDDVSRRATRPADGVRVAEDIDAVAEVAERIGHAGVRADDVSRHKVLVAGNGDTVRDVQIDDILRCACRSADRVSCQGNAGNGPNLHSREVSEHDVARN